MQTIKLEPLAKSALYSQLNAILGYFNHSDVDTATMKDGYVINSKTGQRFELASQEEEEAYKAKKKAEEEAELEMKRHKYDNHPNPIIDFNNQDRWREALKIAKDDMSKAVEMCEEAYWHFLECVPPKRMQSSSYVCGEPYSHNSKGEGVYLCGIKIKDKYYAQYGTVSDYSQGKLFKNI